MTFYTEKSALLCRPAFASLDAHGGISVNALAGTPSSLTTRRLEQDVELFLFAGKDTQDISEHIDRLLAEPLPTSKTAFIALAQQLSLQQYEGTLRGAIIAGNAQELNERLQRLRGHLLEKSTELVDMGQGCFLGSGDGSARIAFLFTGQTAPPYRDGGLIRRRFRFVDELYSWADLPQEGDENATTTAQPALIVSSVAAIALLDHLGISAEIGIGHSLGELIALYWAGAMDKDTMMDLTRVRSRAMISGSPTGGGLAIRAGREQIEPWLAGKTIYVSGLMGPQMTMVAGDAGSLVEVAEIARLHNVQAVLMPIKHGFHSPCIQSAVPLMAEYLANVQFQKLQKRVISTVFARELQAETDLVDLLCLQIVTAISLMPAIQIAASEIDFFIEAGPGKMVSAFAAQCSPVPSYPVDAGGASLRDLLHVVGYAFVLGKPVKISTLFADI